MKRINLVLVGIIVFLLGTLSGCKSPTKDESKPVKSSYEEPYRPQVHFTPAQHWMNDPNGMVYYKGEYHLFYQYYPDGNVWGPMHWGHAVSTDLIHWKHLPIALYPDSLGYIFSGSAVVDKNNTTGLGTKENPPLVAIYTSHDPVKEKEGRNDFQTQSIAYSLDSGRTWTKYAGNPVLSNPGIRDFRDPKVIWFEPDKKWIMTLAVHDHVSFYSSPNLMNWKHESDFGKETGAHGGVWECPDLFPMDFEGQTKWILLSSINPGAPNGGSGTQYFVGDFDGHQFTDQNSGTAPHWIDYGKDNYAGVTWSDIPATDGRRIFLGWMSNWQYATVVPTTVWRSAMTLPRKLSLYKDESGNVLLEGYPVHELDGIAEEWETPFEANLSIGNGHPASFQVGKVDAYDVELTMDISQSQKVTLSLSNKENQLVKITIDKASGLVEVDRTKSGETSFSPEFPVIITAPFQVGDNVSLRFVVDQSSIELFMNDGKLEMTNLVFPKEIYNQIQISSDSQVTVKGLKYRKLKSIWR